MRKEGGMYALGWEREREMLNELIAVEIKGKKVRKKERFVEKKEPFKKAMALLVSGHGKSRNLKFHDFI
jgi:hypothetical protein